MVNGIIDLGRLSKNKHMGWSSTSYPMEMNNISKAVKSKAIDIANSLIASDVVDEKAIELDEISHATHLTQKRKHKNISIENMYSKEGFNFPYHF